MKTSKTIKAFAFDLDGTLVDSAPGLTEALNAALQSLSLPTVTQDQVKIWVGNGVDVLISRTLSAIKAPETFQSQMRTLFDAAYEKTSRTGTVLYPQVKETLDQLQQRGYPMALVTNKPSQFLPELLATLGLETYFSLIIGGGDLSQQKPHPAPLYHVLATFGLYADELLFVGDSRNDIVAAQSAHCPTVGLSYGYNYGESIAITKPDFVCEHFQDILMVIN